MSAQQRLIEALKSKQRQKGMSPTAFAAHLGISESYYARLRFCHQAPGTALLRRIMQLYPDLADVCREVQLVKLTGSPS